MLIIPEMALTAPDAGECFNLPQLLKEYVSAYVVRISRRVFFLYPEPKEIFCGNSTIGRDKSKYTKSQYELYTFCGLIILFPFT